MFLISHRGNVNSIDRFNENKPDYIKNALDLNYDVEVDVRFFKNKAASILIVLGLYP